MVFLFFSFSLPYHFPFSLGGQVGVGEGWRGLNFSPHYFLNLSLFIIRRIGIRVTGVLVWEYLLEFMG